MAAQQVLTVTIVGGGIAGLSAALAFRRAGHVVHVYEQSSLNNEVGAAIHIPPNATRALLAWGLDPVRAKLVLVKSSFRAKADTLERFHVGTTEASMAQTYGAPWYFARTYILGSSYLSRTQEIRNVRSQTRRVSWGACKEPKEK